MGEAGYMKKIWIMPVFASMLALCRFAAYADGNVVPKEALEHYYNGGRLLREAEAAEDSAGLYNKALEEFKSAITMAPGNFNFVYNLGKTYESLGRCAEAIASYEEAYKMVGGLENKELVQSMQTLAMKGVTRCREKSGDRKGAMEATRKAMDGRPKEESAAEYGRLAKYYLQTGNITEARKNILMVDPGSPLAGWVRQQWLWACQTKFTKAECWIEPFADKSGKADAAPVSFYAKAALADPVSGLQYRSVPEDALPPSNRAILACGRSRDGVDSCFDHARREVERDLEVTAGEKLTAWKEFLLGTILMERGNYQEALETFVRVSSGCAEAKLCAAALHRGADLSAVLREPDTGLELLQTLRNKFPDYNKFPEEFLTHTAGFCGPDWSGCIKPPDVAELLSYANLLREMSRLQRDISASQDETDFAYISTQVALGRLYDKYCPKKFAYAEVCPDTVALYKRIHEAAPEAPEGDYVFYRLQQSRFCSEYTGDEVALSQDTVALYGPLIEQYPDSPYADQVRQSYAKAKSYLEKLPSPPAENLGCSFYR